MITRMAFALAKRRVLRTQAAKDAVSERTRSDTTHRDWRADENQGQLAASFDTSFIAGKDVLDFGCGEGFLTGPLAELGARSILGLDASPQSIERAKVDAAALATTPRIDFKVANDTSRIDAPDQSSDLICCFDVMEHVSPYAAIIREWHRVLRPGGRVWIVWTPYRHPYGHHLREWVPLPWGHLILGQRRMLRISERIVDEPAFRPPLYDFDADGTRRNRFRGRDTFGSYLNNLTTGSFESLARQAGLRIRRRRFRPLLADSSVAVVTRGLVRLPWIRDLFIAQAIYELERQ